MLSPSRAPNLGKIRQRACLRLIPFPGTGDVLLAPSMISHPLAYVAQHPRHLVPTVGLGAPSSGDLFWTRTLFLPSERSQPDTPDGVAAARCRTLSSPARRAASLTLSARSASLTTPRPTWE